MATRSSSRFGFARLGRRRRVTRLLTAASLTLALVAAPVVAETVTASAAPTGPTSLSQAFASSPATLLQALACPAGKTVQQATSTIPGVSTLTSDLANIVCAVKVLGYVYRTTYLPPSGPPVVRYTRAVVGAPALLDVTGAGVADVSGTVSPTVIPVGLALTVARLGLPANAKVSVEAFFLDPTSGTTFVGIGEDGTAAGIPASYRAAIGALLTNGTSIDAQLSLRTSPANEPSNAATVADVLFGSNPDAPSSIDHGSLGFAPMPANFTTRVRIGPSSQDVTVTSPTKTTLSAEVDVTNPGDKKVFDASINQLTTSTDVIHQTLSNGHEQTVYTAKGVVAHVSGSYRDIDTANGDAIKVAAGLDLTTLPSALTVDQYDGQTSLTLPTGVIGSVEARFATGQDLPPIGAGTSPYIAFHRYDTSHLTAGIRLTNIKSASFDSSGPYVGDIVFSPAPATIPLQAEDDVSGILATGHLSNLPAHLTVSVDLTNDVVVFNGHGTGISEITIDAVKQTPFFGRATRVALTIDGVPALATVNFGQSDGSVSFTPSVPIGSVSLLASDGSGAPVVSGDYVSYEDTPTLFRAFAQVTSIGALAFTPPSSDGTVPLSGELKSGSPQKLTLYGHIQDATHNINVSGTIDAIPSDISFSLTKNTDGSQTLDYNSHGEVINTVTLDATGLPLPFNADTAHVVISHIPSHISIQLPTAGGDAIFNPYGDHIGEVLVQVYPHAIGAYNNPNSGDQTAYANLATGQFTADLKQIGYTDISTDGDNISAKWDISTAPFDITFVDSDPTKYFQATLSNPEPATITQISSPDNPGLKLDYKVDESPGTNFVPGSTGEINSIGVTSTITGQFIQMTLQHIAPQLVICFDGQSMLCVPQYVAGESSDEPGRVATDQPNDDNVIPPSFGIQVLPLTDDSHVDVDPTKDMLTTYQVRMRLDGHICLDEATDSCQGQDHQNWVDISDLEFGTVEAGFGLKSHDCNVYCAQLFGYFNTNGTVISGDVKYYSSDTSLGAPLVEYNAPAVDDSNPQNGISATDWYDRIHVVAANLEADPFEFGGFTLVGDPLLNINLGHHVHCNPQFEVLHANFSFNC